MLTLFDILAVFAVYWALKWGTGLGCTGIGSRTANRVGLTTSHGQGYKMASTMPADSSENLLLSQRNDGPEQATIARDRYIL